MSELPFSHSQLEPIDSSPDIADFVTRSGSLLESVRRDRSREPSPYLTRLSTNPEVRTALWERRDDDGCGYERLGINLVSRSLIIALDHRHYDALRLPRIGPDVVSNDFYQRISLVVSSIDGESQAEKTSHPHYRLYRSHPLRANLVDGPPQDGEALLAFRDRFDHAVARFGLRRYLENLQDVG